MRQVRWVAVFLLVGLICEGVGFASERERRIEQLIQDAIDQRHPTDRPEWWKQLGPETPGVILSMIQKSESTYQKVRLVDALGWFKDTAAEKEARRLAEVGASGGAIRHAAIRAVARSTGDVEFITRVLQDEDPQTRWVAVKMLQELGTPTAQKRLEAHLKTEPVGWIAQKLQRQAPVGAPGSLIPVSTSDSGGRPLGTLSEDWLGTWSGWILHPRAGAKGMNELELQLRIGRNTDGSPRVEWLRRTPQDAVEGVSGAALRGRVLSFELPAAWKAFFTQLDEIRAPKKPARKLEGPLTLQLRVSEGQHYLEGSGLRPDTRLFFRKDGL